jgi:molecular chaperone HscB
VSATLQACRNCGAGAPLDAHFCPQCTKILPLARQRDYFSFMGLPRKLAMNASDLETRFRSLSRQFHPDYFYNASAAERLASLERSSFLNDAYRTLRSAPARLEYLLKLEGLAPKGPEEAARQVPAALLEEVFALNEELDEIRSLRESGAPGEQWKQRLERARQPIDAKRGEHETQIEDLSAQWDAAVDRGATDAERRAVLEALQERFLERNYIINLLAGIERELSS